MNRIRKSLLVLVAILLVASVASAGKPTSCFNTQDSAIQSNKRVNQLVSGYQREGYDLQSSAYTPVYYFAVPQPPYVDGTMTYTMTRTYGGYSLQVDYAVIEVEVTTLDCGYMVSRITTTEYTVY